MTRLFAVFLFCITGVTASDQIPEISIFSRVALQEIWEGKAAQATCLVIGELHGSGVLVSLGEHVCILTSAHLGTPKSVYFMVPDKTAANLKLDSMKFLVRTFISMQKELRCTTAQHDLQILLVEGNPEQYIEPLKLTSEIDTSQPISGYGLGNLVAEFFPGRLSVRIPAQYSLDERGEARQIGLLPSKVMFPNYQVNPIATWWDRIKLGASRVYQKFNPLITITGITPTTHKIDGIILATPRYSPVNLETHIGGGFSGGAALQNDTVVGLFQGGSLQAEEVQTSIKNTISTYQFLSMWSLYLAGQKLPVLKKIAPFACDPIISPSIRYVLGRLGYTYLSTPMRLCIFNTAVFAAVTIYLVGNKMYARSQRALKRSHKAAFVHMTPAIIEWIKSALNSESTQPAASS